MLTVRTNFPDVQREFERVRQEIRDKAMASAINKTIDQVRTLASREITSTYNVTSAYAKERLRVRRATARAGQLRLEATLVGGDGKRRAANVIAFVERSTTLAQARKRRKAGTLDQLYVKIKRGGPAKPVKGAFIGNRGRTVFERVGKARLPIKPVQTIDIGQMMMSRKVNGALNAFARAKFPELFRREVAFFMARGQ